MPIVLVVLCVASLAQAVGWRVLRGPIAFLQYSDCRVRFSAYCVRSSGGKLLNLEPAHLFGLASVVL